MSEQRGAEARLVTEQPATLELQAVPDVDVVVAGGGIGGLANALALTREGLQVRLLEQAPAFGEVGAGLQVAPNASRVLREWGVLDEVVARGVVPARMVMRDALDGTELTRLDLQDVERRYGAPYVVIHRSDLHEVLLEACRHHGVDLVTDAPVRRVEVGADRAVVVRADGARDGARVVVAADGLQSTLRRHFSDDQPVSSGYVAYRGAVPFSEVADRRGVALNDVVVYVGPGCHFVQYALRGGLLLNQVAVFRSPRAQRGDADWGTPDELDDAFAGTCEDVRRALPALWRDRWWQMFDREPITSWVDRRLVLTGDAAHPMLQYLAQGACQAIEDAHQLARAVHTHTAGSPPDVPEAVRGWDEALREYADVRPTRTAAVQRTARFWGEFWHCDGLARTIRNALLRDRDPADYRYVDWLYAPAELVDRPPSAQDSVLQQRAVSR